jgi:transposase
MPRGRPTNELPASALSTEQKNLIVPLQQGGMAVYVGWDWASKTHDITVVDDEGKIVDHFDIAHDEVGLTRALKRLARHGSPDSLDIAIERPSGLVVERLVEAGHPVVPIHPNAFNAARSRWGASRAKSDPGDSYRLADYLRTDGHRLRRLRPMDEATRNLQALVRMRDDHVEVRIAAFDQLEALLQAHWPGAVGLFYDLASDIALEFLERYPTPESAARLGEVRLSSFLKRHSYCGRRPAAELLLRLHAAPLAPSRLDPDVLIDLVREQVLLVRTMVKTTKDLEHAIAAAVADHPKASLLAHLPRIGSGVNLAQVISEVGPILEASVDVEHAAAQCGAFPVTKASGQTRGVHFRWAANNHARKALSLFADNSRHSCQWAARLYSKHIALNKRHPHANRILMRAWLRVIWACWQNNTPYDPARHQAGVQLATA